MTKEENEGLISQPPIPWTPIYVSEKILHEWQLCPKCEGIGMMTVMYPGYAINQTATCDVCNGKKIISKINGLPPI